MSKSEITTQNQPEANKNVQQTEHLQMMMAQLDGADITSKMSPEHITEMLKQRGDVFAYINQDKKDGRWDNKFYFCIIIAVFTGISLLVFFLKDDYFGEVMSLFAGLLGGYGFGKTKGE